MALEISEYNYKEITLQIVFYSAMLLLALYAAVDLLTYVFGLPPLIGGWKSMYEWSVQIAIPPFIPLLARHVWLMFRALYRRRSACVVEGKTLIFDFWPDFKILASNIRKIGFRDAVGVYGDRRCAILYYVGEHGEEKRRTLDLFLFKHGTIRTLAEIRDALDADFEIDISAVRRKLSPELIALAERTPYEAEPDKSPDGHN